MKARDDVNRKVRTPGSPVRVRDLPVDGHYRAPHYVRNQTGWIERYCGAFPNPERLAYGEDGLPAVPLYRVRFAQTKLWPGYEGSKHDTLELEIYEHWLEDSPANGPAGEKDGA